MESRSMRVPVPVEVSLLMAAMVVPVRRLRVIALSHHRMDFAGSRAWPGPRTSTTTHALRMVCAQSMQGRLNRSASGEADGRALRAGHRRVGRVLDEDDDRAGGSGRGP